MPRRFVHIPGGMIVPRDGVGPTGAVVVVRLFSGAMVEEMEMLLYKHGNVKCDMSPGKRWGREDFSCNQMVVLQFG